MSCRLLTQNGCVRVCVCARVPYPCWKAPRSRQPLRPQRWGAGRGRTTRHKQRRWARRSGCGPLCSHWQHSPIPACTATPSWLRSSRGSPPPSWEPRLRSGCRHLRGQRGERDWRKHLQAALSAGAQVCRNSNRRWVTLHGYKNKALNLIPLPPHQILL